MWPNISKLFRLLLLRVPNTSEHSCRQIYAVDMRRVLTCASAAEQSTVTTGELTQHKNYLKVITRQEREMKATERKYQKRSGDLIQKYSDAFKGIKKKVSLKKAE